MEMTDHGLPGGVNPLDFLHKLAMQRGLQRPEFLQLGEEGLPHNKTFVWQCSFNNVMAQASGRSKKEAKVAAARAVRDLLNFEELPPAPSYQALIERKRKRDSNGVSQNNGDSKKAKNYDYSRHFQCYGAAEGSPAMGVPYGYPVDGPHPHQDMGPNPIDPFGLDPFQNDGSGLGGGENYAGAVQGPVAPMNRGFLSRLSKLDRYVIKKHTDIYPSEANLNAILKLVMDVELAMKVVADEWNKDDQNTIKVEGVVRVGDLAKGLLLANDKSVSVVLLCHAPPTGDMLRKFHVETRSKIKETDSNYDTLLLEKEAAFAASKPIMDDASGEKVDSYFCYVTFSSTSLRKQTPETSDESSDDSAMKIEVKREDESEDMLPKEKCLQALAEVRHARWFSNMAANLPSCVECIRIMKDLVRRDPAWTALSEWCIELLVERSLYSAWRPLNPAASLMRVMEVVASGLLMDENAGLKDPCERDDLDTTRSLTLQEREDITRGAQHYLRQMHFRQIFKVLGMPMEESDDNAKEEDTNDKEQPAEAVSLE